jgi:Tol biopolymer transport system component
MATTILSRRVVRWLLSGAAFAAVVASSGCSLLHRNSATSQSQQTAVREPDGDPEAFAAPNATAPSQINIFGEVDGAPTGPVRPIGDEGFQQHTFADEGYDSDVSIDPTGKWIAFASTRHSEHAAIYLQRVDGTAVTKLTADDADNAFPSFSPDGKSIAFCSTRSGVWNVYVMDTDGRNVMSVTSGQMQCVHPSFSPDGTRLVFSALGSRSNQWELWTVNLTSGEKRQIGYGLFPNWSPSRDGDRIAFQRARQRGSRWFSLWTLELNDGEAHRVTEVAVSSNAAIVSPGWSPDGKRLVFATIIDPSRNHGAVTHRRGEQDIWTVNADGSDRRRLTDGNGVNLSPVWGADNRVYFISDRGGTESVWSVRPDNGGQFTASAPKAKAPGDSAVGSNDTRDIEH